MGRLASLGQVYSGPRALIEDKHNSTELCMARPGSPQLLNLKVRISLQRLVSIDVCYLSTDTA